MKVLTNILALRHGRTNYTEQGLDLTPEGEEASRKVAKEHVMPWLEKLSLSPRDLNIITSPAVRAQGTAMVIAEAIRHLRGMAIREALAPMAWRDKERAAAILGEMKKHGGYVDYETEECFDDPTIFEPRSEVKERLNKFLAQHIMLAICHPEVHRATMLVTHYEVLCNLTHEVFGIVASEATALQHTEPLYFVLSHTDEPNVILFEGHFRDLVNFARFDLEKQQFVR